MDGHFVPNLTFGPFITKAIGKCATKPLDVHLMITDPWQYADPFLDAGADCLTFHVEVEENGDVRELLQKIRARGAKAGLSVQPDTPVERLRPYVDDLDLVLVMSVFAGFGGQKFMTSVLPKVAELRDMGFQGEVSMDGGISPDTIAPAPPPAPTCSWPALPSSVSTTARRGWPSCASWRQQHASEPRVPNSIDLHAAALPSWHVARISCSAGATVTRFPQPLCEW